MYAIDRPVCGFPSLHVSASLASMFIKQHVFLDVLGGVALGIGVYYLTELYYK